MQTLNSIFELFKQVAIFCQESLYVEASDSKATSM